MKGNCGAIAIKSESGKVFDFYRSEPIEKPKNFKLTQLYTIRINQIKKIIDYFNFIETTRVRIHKSNQDIKSNYTTDDNNIHAKVDTDFRLRMITALNHDSDFIYTYEYNGVYIR